ncbi:MAG: DUF4365 domain-containing protein, partial [Acidobacteria bacterium]|nr:DUF4365 domain-containing protein [Acidobacteriota bacterium]
QVQSKATERRFPAETAVKFHYTCDENDLRYWLEGNTPVILVVSRPRTDEAYWVSVKSYFKDQERRASRRIVFDKKRDRFDEHSTKALMDLASKPETTVREDWQRLRARLDDLDPHYRVVPSGDRSWSIQGKRTGGETPAPFEISFRMSIPDTSGGRELLERYRRHVATGAELKIPQTFLRDVRLPDFMTQFIDFSKTAEGQIIIGTRQKLDVGEVNVEIECDDGERAALSHIKLDLVQHGTDEATLNNVRQRSLWQVEFVWNMKEESAQLNFTAKDGKFNVKPQLEWMRFQRAFSRGGVLRMVNTETGIVAMEQRFPPGLLDPPSAVAIELVDKVLYIQGKTRVLLSVPDELNQEEIDEILATEQLLKTGKVTFRGKGEWKIAAHLELARRLLEIYGNGMPAQLDWHWEGGAVNLFGTEIEVGATDMYCAHTYLTEEDHEALKEFVANPEPDGTVSVAIKFVENSPIHASYPRWLPKP